ncbi:hypothetical protein D3C73_955150 [compost metagenome]|jgi:hypothetical protein
MGQMTNNARVTTTYNQVASTARDIRAQNEPQMQCCYVSVLMATPETAGQQGIEAELAGA